VKEYLMSSRLAEATDIIPRRYHISVTVAHTLVAQACLGILLHLDKDVVTSDSLKEVPFAEYAAEYWAGHALLEGVSQNVEDGIKQLFDPSKSHLAVCIWIHDPEPSFLPPVHLERPEPLRGTTLHYAALWGLHPIVESLVIKHPQDVHSHGSPKGCTPLHFASDMGHVEVARFLLEHGADVTALNMQGETPLHLASKWGRVEVADLLIERGADVTLKDDSGSTPLHAATTLGGNAEIARLLIERGADVTVKDKNGWTPLHKTSRVILATLFIECGADVSAQTSDTECYTPLDLASLCGNVETAGVLIDRGADMTAQEGCRTPLHLASLYGQMQVVGMLIERGSDVTAQDEDGKTPLHLASRRPNFCDLRLTPLRPTPKRYAKVARVLLERGADVTVRDKNGMTPLQVALSDEGCAEVAQFILLFLQHRADSGSGPVFTNESIHTLSQHIGLPLEAGLYSPSDDISETGFSGSDYTDFSHYEGDDVASSDSDEGLAEVAQIILLPDPVSSNASISAPLQRIPLPSEALYSHSDDVPDTEVSGNDPTGFLGEEGEVEGDEEPRPKRRKVDGGYC
jgi:ankyrin repeat protein